MAGGAASAGTFASPSKRQMGRKMRAREARHERREEGTIDLATIFAVAHWSSHTFRGLHFGETQKTGPTSVVLCGTGVFLYIAEKCYDGCGDEEDESEEFSNPPSRISRASLTFRRIGNGAEFVRTREVSSRRNRRNLPADSSPPRDAQNLRTCRCVRLVPIRVRAAKIRRARDHSPPAIFNTHITNIDRAA